MVNALFIEKARFAVDFPIVLRFSFLVPVVGPRPFALGKNFALDCRQVYPGCCS